MFIQCHRGNSERSFIMAAKKFDRSQIMNLAVGGILTAIVIVLQLMGSFIKFGPFAVSLVLAPIIIGAAMCGPVISTWLGFVFGLAVLLSGDAAAFLAISAPGTIVTVLLKGALCGLVAGVIFSALKKVNTYLAVVVSAILCPVTNTGVFLLGCRIFFFDAIKEWGTSAGFTNAASYMIVGLVGFNFLFELITNIVLCPVIIGIINAVKASRK